MTLNLSEFYRPHHDGRCKTCLKQYAKEFRIAHRDELAAFERKRRKSAKRRAQIEAADARYMQRYPDKKKAKTALSKAIESGRITKPDICSECGADQRIQGHHPDYAKPLDVIWLCEPCHKALHRRESQSQTKQEHEHAP